MTNKCLHCLTGDKWDKENCLTCNGTGFSRKHIHKGCRSNYNYPICDRNCNMHNAMVTRRWELVTCPSCLKLRKKK